MDVSELELQSLYTWVDEIPLSRPKRNIARDFSDGVLMAEIVRHFYPKLVELHNYSSANGLQQKMYNWNTLNAKVFKRLGFVVPKPDVEAVCNCQAGAVERVLKLIKTRIAKYVEDGEPDFGPAPTTTLNGAPGSKDLPGAGPRGNNFAAPQGHFVQAGMHTGLGLTKGGPINYPHLQMDASVSAEKDQTITELNETNTILETKVRKLEQLVRLKDAKIQTLMAKLTAAGLS